MHLIDDTTIVNVNKSSVLSEIMTDNNNRELSGNFNAKHNNESTIGSRFTNVSINDNNNYDDNFICPPVTSSKFIKKESHDD